MKIIECVPNFSEGRNDALFQLMKDSVRYINNCKLLSLEPDGDYNRVVVTLAGDDEGIIEGAMAVCKAAASEIDMKVHRGEHPRLGAIDVVPFIPVKNTTMEECVKISKIFGQRLSDELNIPVYLYENSAADEYRRNLSDIRKGEYEGLKLKLQQPEWYPDFGNNLFNDKLGAAVTGARFFLIAYNVNLISNEVKYAKEVGEILRESGTTKRDIQGNVIKVDGKAVKIPGRLKCVKGMGVALEKYKLTQVSMNLTNYNITPIHTAFEEVKKEAERLGIEVKGSEIVGLVPLDALLLAGRYYAEGKQYNEAGLVDLAIEKLGLNSLNPFHKQDKIIDYMI